MAALHLVILMAVLGMGYCQCPSPEPVVGLVQFINGNDVSAETATSYPINSRITAQCNSPGEMQLTGNMNGQRCRTDGKWSGQAPFCREVTEKISVDGGAVQRVTPEGYLNVYTTPTENLIQVRCTIDRRYAQLEASHIQVDNSRVAVGDTRDGTSRISYMNLTPPVSTDSGRFGCKKSVGAGSPTYLRIYFYELSLDNIRQMDCPSDIVQATDPGMPDATVSWTEPASLVAFGITAVNKSHVPGDSFPIGTTQVLYTSLTDGTEICRFTVTVIDEEDPTFITCPENIVRGTDQGVAIAVVNWSPIVALDNSRVISAPEGNYLSGHAFPVGTTLVSYLARDESGNENFCNFTVNVEDHEPPTIHNCPESITASITDIYMDYVRVYWTEPNVTDNTELFSLVPSHTPGDRFTYSGEPTDVSYIARDTSNNENRCIFQITVLDKASPVFSDCPSSQIQYLYGNETTVPVFWQQPAPGDNIDIVGPTVPSHTPGQRFGLGTHTVTYVAWDSSLNNGTCVFNVTVKKAKCVADVTPYQDGVLTWKSALASDLVPSLERCSVYKENAGSFLALRECVPDEVLGAVWLEPRLNNCGDDRESIDLKDLSEVSIGEGNVMEVSQAFAQTVSNMTFDLADNLQPVADILHNIVKAESPLVEVTKAVIETVDSVISSVSEHDALYDTDSDHQEPSFGQASSSIVKSLESQISLVAGGETDFQITQERLAVSVVTVPVSHQNEETLFLTVLDEEDPDSSVLRGGAIQTLSKGERGDSAGVSWPIDTSITLPANIGTEVKHIMGYDNPKPLRVSFVVYQTDGLFASENASRMFPGNNNSGEYFTSGRVISSAVEGVQLKNLSQPVVIEFTPHQEWNDSIGIAQCVYWDFSLGINGTGDWSSEGCKYSGYEDGRIVCHCNHLTNFAVIMGMKDEKLTPVAQFFLDFISAVGCALSIAGVALTLFTFLVFGNLRTTRSRQILIHLCFSLLGLYVVFVSGIDAVNHDIVCMAVAVAIHYFTLTSMFWMCVEARNMYLLLVRVFKGRESRFMAKASVFAWGIPLVIVACTFGITFPKGMYRHQDFCFLLVGPAQYYGLLAPIGLILLHNIVTFILVVRSLVKNDMGGSVNKQRTQLEKLSCRLQNAVCMSVLLGLSWGFGFLSITIGSFVYQLFFCLANSIQGFLVFVLFCARSTDVRKAWRHAMPIECNLRGQSYKIQERSRINVMATEAWNCPAKLSEEDGPGLDVYMYTSWSGDGSSRWDDSKYISYNSQVSHVSNGTSVIRPFSIYSSENGTVGKKKMSLF